MIGWGRHWRRLARAASGLAAIGGAALVATPGAAQTRIDTQPYVELRQVVSVGLDDGDTNAFTGIAAGIDLRARNRRVEGQISYRYERRFSWDNGNFDSDTHSGLAQVRAELVPRTLNLNAGAIAARSRRDAQGPIFGFEDVDVSNVVDVYGLYVGPDFSRRIGGIDVTASYRLGYVEVDDRGLDGLPLIPGQVVLDRFDRSTTHNASLSIGQGVGRLPFGWTIGAGYVREDIDRLDQEFEAKYVRADIVVPVSPTFALTAGIGHERIHSSQQDFLRDSGGRPIVTPGGNLIADPTRPRLESFATDGLIYDGGFIWRPGRRTEVQARLGHRYGGTTFTASLDHRLNSAWGVTGRIYDSVDGFGRLLVTDLSGVPLDFDLDRSGFDPGIGGIGGCVFGSDPGTGICFDQLFQSITATDFRNRGASVLLSGGRGLWRFGFGASYNRRKYLSSRFQGLNALDRVIEESFTLSANADRRLSRTSNLSIDLYALWSDIDVPAIDGATGLGASVSVNKRLYNEQLEGFGTIGLFHSRSNRIDRTIAAASAGLRYNF